MTKWIRILFPALAFLLIQFLINRLLVSAFGLDAAIGSCVLLPFVAFIAFKEKLNIHLLWPFLVVLLALCFIVGKVMGVAFIILIGTCLAGPINEELIYRGFTFCECDKRVGLIPAVLISSALFAVAHATLPQIALSFFLGCLLCFVVKRFKNLSFPIVLHCALNLLLFYFLRG